MTKSEAIELLANAPREPMPCALNGGITQSQSVDIVLKAVESKPDDSILEDWLAKRVRQVAHPVYKTNLSKEHWTERIRRRS